MWSSFKVQTKNPVFRFPVGAGGWLCDGRTHETQKEHAQRSATCPDWPIFSSQVGMWSQKRAYEPIRRFQIASCAECDSQIDGRSMSRTSANFGCAERSLFRFRRANTCERCLWWYWTDCNQVFCPDLSDLRPDCQNPQIGCSCASRYWAFEKTILSTFWSLSTSSKALWSVIQQSAPDYLV